MVLKSANSRTKFVYKPRSPDSVRAHAVRRRYDSIWKDGTEVFRPKEGDNQLRVLPSTWGDRDHYAYRIFLHSFVGPDNGSYLCLRRMKNERCAICEAANAARDDGEEEDARSLQAVERWACYVIHRDDRNAKVRPKIYEIVPYVDADLCALAESKKTGKVKFIDDPENGYDITIRRTGTGLNTRYLPQIDSEASPIADDRKDQEEILDYISENPIPDMLKFCDNDYLEKMISGGAKQKDEDEDEEVPAAKSVRRHAKKYEEETEAPFDEEDQEEVITDEDDEEGTEDYRETRVVDVEEAESAEEEEEDFVEEHPAISRTKVRPVAVTNKDRNRIAEAIDKRAVARPGRLGTGPVRRVKRRD